MKRRDHSWAAAFWKPVVHEEGSDSPAEILASAKAICILCPAVPQATIKLYETARHRSKAWEHTVTLHPSFNPQRIGTLLDYCFARQKFCCYIFKLYLHFSC